MIRNGFQKLEKLVRPGKISRLSRKSRQVEIAMERCTVRKDAVYILYVSFLVFSGWFAPILGLFLSLLLFAWACLLSLSEDEQKALLS